MLAGRLNVKTAPDLLLPGRARHEAPGRGVLRTIGAIAARSASLYFRYGGAATTAFRGVQLASGVSSLRWSSLAARVVLPNLTVCLLARSAGDCDWRALRSPRYQSDRLAPSCYEQKNRHQYA